MIESLFYVALELECVECLLVMLFHYVADNLSPFVKIISQVEMIIDNSQETPKDNVLSRFTIEASLFDTKGWYESDSCADLISSKVANLKLNIKSTPLRGFHGYLLSGKLDAPKLWSAEQVRKLGF